MTDSETLVRSAPNMARGLSAMPPAAAPAFFVSGRAGDQHGGQQPVLAAGMLLSLVMIVRTAWAAVAVRPAGSAVHAF